jgi:hypothetical protein
MTEAEIAEVFETLHLESEEARRAAAFDALREKGRLQFQVSMVNNTGFQPLETLARRQKENRKQLKQAVFEIYGGCCSCCGERAFEFLSIDHVLGGGNKERKTISIPQLYRRLFEAGVRQERYRVLCYYPRVSASLFQWF